MAASAPTRQMASGRKGTTMRPPPIPRPGVNRAQTATPTLNGRATPIEHAAVRRSPKRKAPTDLLESSVLEETNINVVVRCRGRNDREVRENSAVVVSSDGIKGKNVELSMGPNALSNKTYQFDKVFSPAADQGMIFDEVVTPILDEVLAGFNCTIFAYGQTGTGKTYTMSGDISDILPIPEAAGIIPRTLHSLFDKLNADDAKKMDTTVKCSFIELYNEELKDLLAVDESTKLKIFDDTNKNGRTTTMVQGMEETHIESASKGIQLLCTGSHKRQVAATKCNDLSSRSHTVFTMTIYTKRLSEAGEEFISASKLNLVDLAGSENIQRSGAENKRAAEAGLINKSLLTLGRVINALVDRSSHIPYRESKLTRLLQDSLGGQTKTCVIATLSPAKSNLEETISTLDYAFRAKNIRNKPQLNQLVSKKTLLREFTSEIEKLKSELIATRHRNGYYLTADAYEELTTQSESRRILSEEQRDKIETMENNLRNKVQELFSLTNNFQTMRKDNDKIKGRLDSTRDLLDNTELVLGHAKRSLAEEIELRKAHAATEEQLLTTGKQMQQMLEATTSHVEQLHAKIERKSQLEETNHSKWADTEARVRGGTAALGARLESIRQQQSSLFSAMSARITNFVQDELTAARASRNLVEEKSRMFDSFKQETDRHSSTTRDEMNRVLDEVCDLREDVKAKVGSGLDDLANTAQRISAGIAQELDDLRENMEESQSSLTFELTSIFDNIMTKLKEQQLEIIRLREQNTNTQSTFMSAQEEARVQMQQKIEDERVLAQTERSELLSKIGSLIQDASVKQEKRLASHVDFAAKRIKTSESEYRMSNHSYGQAMDTLNGDSDALLSTIERSKASTQARLDAGLTSMSSRIADISTTTQAVHTETIAAISAQKGHMDDQLTSLDSIVERVKAQNDEHDLANASTLSRMVETAKESFAVMHASLDSTSARASDFEKTMHGRDDLEETLAAFDSEGPIHNILGRLREDIDAADFDEYKSTGLTPARMQYAYPAVLPRTEPRDVIVDAMHGTGAAVRAMPSPIKSISKRSPRKRGFSPTKIPVSPSKTLVFNDLTNTKISVPNTIEKEEVIGSPTTLREVDANIRSTTQLLGSDSSQGEEVSEVKPLKPIASTGRKHKHDGKVQVKKGRENLMPIANAGFGVNAVSSSRRSLRSRGTEQP